MRLECCNVADVSQCRLKRCVWICKLRNLAGPKIRDLVYSFHNVKIRQPNAL